MKFEVFMFALWGLICLSSITASLIDIRKTLEELLVWYKGQSR